MEADRTMAAKVVRSAPPKCQNSSPDLKKSRGTYIQIQLPMKPLINPQPPRKLPIRQQRLPKQRTQENRHRIIVPKSRDLNRNLHPLIKALLLPIPTLFNYL